MKSPGLVLALVLVGCAAPSSAPPDPLCPAPAFFPGQTVNVFHPDGSRFAVGCVLGEPTQLPDGGEGFAEVFCP